MTRSSRAWASAELARAGLLVFAQDVAPLGVRLAAFKGVSIRFGDHGELFDRFMADADGLIVRGSLRDAVRVARARGYGVRMDDVTQTMIRLPNGALIDVHVRPLPSFVGRVDLEDLTGFLRPAPWSGGWVDEFDDLTQAVLTLANLAKDRFAEQTTHQATQDLAVLERRGVTVAAALERAGQLRLRRMVIASLAACGRLSIDEAPSGHRDVARLRRLTSVRWKAALAYRMLDDGPGHGLLALTAGAFLRPLSRWNRRWR